MKFSIAVPVYKQAQFIRNNLESLRQQKIPFELAILDATPDNSVQEILSSYQDLITYQYHRKDEGQTAAIQEGWDNTSGEIVAWLNADDYYFPDTLEKIAKVFAEHPEVDVVYGHSIFVDKDNNFQMYFPAISADISQITHGCLISQPSCFIRRSAMEKVKGLNKNLHYTMDWDFWIRLYKAGCKFHFLPEVLSVVTIHDETKTLSGSKKRYNEINNILKINGVSNLSRLKTMLGFYYYDLSNKDQNLIEKFNYHALTYLQKFKAKINNRKKPVIHGIECWSNKVNDHCEITMPWYQTTPKTVAVFANTPKNISLQINGSEIKLTLKKEGVINFLGNMVCAYVHVGTLPSLDNQIFNFKIQSSQPTWQLLGLNLA